MQKRSSADVDPDLREYLRQWRQETAKENGLAAFIIMHDKSLDELCRIRPRSLSQLRSVSGFGERKTEVYGKQILAALERFQDGARAAELPPPRKSRKKKEWWGQRQGVAT